MKIIVTFLITTRGNLQAKLEFPCPNIPRILEYENTEKIYVSNYNTCSAGDDPR